MMKRILMIAALLCVLPNPAHATDTRIHSMGGKEKAFTVFDEANVFFLPATLLNFPNTVYVDAGLSREYADGLNVPYNIGFAGQFGLSENTILGFYGSNLSRYVSGDVMARAFSGEGLWGTEYSEVWHEFSDKDKTGEQAIHNANYMGTLMFGQRFGKKVRFGLLLSLWGDSYSVDDPDTAYVDKGGTWFQGAIGLGVDLTHKSSFDIGLKLDFGSFDDGKYSEGNKVTRIKSDTHFGLDLLVRGNFDIGGKKLIPFVKAAYMQGGVELNQDGAVRDEFYQFKLDIGADFQLQPLENVFIYPGFGLTVYQEKIQEGLLSDQQDGLPGGMNLVNKNTVIAPFFSVALDAHVATWCAIRLGLRQFISVGYWEDAAEAGKDNDVLTDFTVGLAFMFSGFTVDFSIDPVLLLRGPYFITGKGYDQFALQGALKYTW